MILLFTTNSTFIHNHPAKLSLPFTAKPSGFSDSMNMWHLFTLFKPKRFELNIGLPDHIHFLRLFPLKPRQQTPHPFYSQRFHLSCRTRSERPVLRPEPFKDSGNEMQGTKFLIITSPALDAPCASTPKHLARARIIMATELDSRVHFRIPWLDHLALCICTYSEFLCPYSETH